MQNFALFVIAIINFYMTYMQVDCETSLNKKKQSNEFFFQIVITKHIHILRIPYWVFDQMYSIIKLCNDLLRTSQYNSFIILIHQSN